MLKRKMNERGSLLLEALLSVVILSVSLTLMIQSMMAGLRSTVYSMDYTTAAILVDHKMFDVLRRRFVEASFLEQANFPPPRDDYRYQLQAASIPVDGQPGPVNELTLDVIWPFGHGEQQVSVVTYLFNPPASGK